MIYLSRSDEDETEFEAGVEGMAIIHIYLPGKISIAIPATMVRSCLTGIGWLVPGVMLTRIPLWL